MPLWTNGPAYVVATSWGVARCEEGKPQVTRWATEGLKKDQFPPELEVFAVLDDEGRQALVRREGEACQLWTAGGGFEPIEGDILDAVWIGENAILAAVGEGERATLRRAKLEKNKLVFGEPIALAATAKVKWPSTIWEKGEERWPESDEDREGEAPFDASALSLRSKITGNWLGRVRLEANRAGVAVTSTYSGLAALIDPKTLKPSACVRVPTELEDIDIFGLPVPQGILLTVVKEEETTEFVLIGPGGDVVAHKNKLGKESAVGSSSAGLLWSDEKVLVNQNSESGAALYFLALPNLTPKQFGKEAVNVMTCGSTPDGAKHIVATGSPNDRKPANWKLLRYDPNAKKVKGETLTMPDFKPPPPPIAKPEKRKRAEGSPVLAMKPDAATPWRAKESESAALKLLVMNRGGPLSGMYVELGGNAVSDALIAGEEATLGGAKARFEKKGSAFRAEISEAHLDAHFADASRADPAPSIDLVVRIRAQRAGNALMTVRVGPLGATGIMGSAMEGRSFIVAPA